MPGCYTDLDLSPNPLELARQIRAAGAGYLDLTSSNPTQQGLLFPAEILQQAAEGYWATRRYQPDPRGNPHARAAIVDYYATRSPALALDPEAIFLTASTSEAYSLLFALLADPGDNLLAPCVTYPLFEYLAALRNIELRSYDLIEAEGWRIDADSLRVAADERTRGVLIISPHNPTGAIIDAALPALTQLGLPIICDEVFAPFHYAAPPAPPLAALHPELPVFTLNGISKLFALPDLKLGWIALNAAASHYAPRIELLNDTFLGANGLTQSLLPHLFAHGMPFVQQMIARVRRNIERACSLLHDHPYLHLHPPAGGYYLFPSVSGWDDEEALALHLINQGVLVHPGFYYGDVPGCHLLISALTDPQVFDVGLAILADHKRW
ncbi:aminotransferase class I and II [Oscillochloris trichoides DG-6]|uniref:Aminotransferase class I and II n=1 Tax=Oscillochloris trichoides DG-6 TaxID=765420 RepID=E1IB65_9CHLR|nr:pyridoxal phosphate-dependent aminotransferase [Oscillochloris trichoides]EFO81550.1 aminotransferase class I and II [Oscillochloris trichoides DG-6]